jgi:hypothetical protein
MLRMIGSPREEFFQQNAEGDDGDQKVALKRYI